MSDVILMNPDEEILRCGGGAISGINAMFELSLGLSKTTMVSELDKFLETGMCKVLILCDEIEKDSKILLEEAIYKHKHRPVIVMKNDHNVSLGDKLSEYENLVVTSSINQDLISYVIKNVVAEKKHKIAESYFSPILNGLLSVLVENTGKEIEVLPVEIVKNSVFETDAMCTLAFASEVLYGTFTLSADNSLLNDVTEAMVYYDEAKDDLDTQYDAISELSSQLFGVVKGSFNERGHSIDKTFAVSCGGKSLRISKNHSEIIYRCPYKVGEKFIYLDFTYFIKSSPIDNIQNYLMIRKNNNFDIRVLNEINNVITQYLGEKFGGTYDKKFLKQRNVSTNQSGVFAVYHCAFKNNSVTFTIRMKRESAVSILIKLFGIKEPEISDDHLIDLGNQMVEAIGPSLVSNVKQKHKILLYEIYKCAVANSINMTILNRSRGYSCTLGYEIESAHIEVDVNINSFDDYEFNNSKTLVQNYIERS